MTIRLMIISICTIFLATACDIQEEEGPNFGNNGKGGSTKAVPVSHRGQWQYIHNGSSVYLGRTTELNLEYTDINIITVKNSGSSDKHLVRAGESSVSIHGSIASLRGTSSNNVYLPSSAGDMDVIMRNIQDPGIGSNVTPDPNGDFNAGDLPGGDYLIGIGDASFETGADNEDNDIGVITIVNGGCNFKSELVMAKDFVYGDHSEYSGNIRISNIGDADCTGLTYNITSDDSFIHSLNFENRPGTIEPGYYRSIPVKLSFKFLDSQTKKLTLNITASDVSGNVWNDRVNATVFRSSFKLNLDRTNTLRGYVKIPGYGIQQLSSSLILPMLPDKQFLVVLSNPDLSYESMYSIAVDAVPSDADELTSTLDGPNNNSNTALVLQVGEKADGFLHKGDIDTFKISTAGKSDYRPVQLSVDRIGVLYDYNSGNNDSFFNKGETVHFDLGIQNTGSSTAIGVKISTSSFSDPYITVTNTCSTGYDIGGGNKRDTDGDFSSSSYYLARNSSGCLKAAAASNTPDGHSVNVPVTITDAYGNIWNSSFNITVTPIQAVLSVDRVGVLYDYTSGNNDSFFNKGETVHFDLGIQNTGSSTAIGVKISTSSFSDPYITVTNTCSTGYDIGGGSKRDTDGDLSSSSYYLARNSSGCLKAVAASNTPDGHSVNVPVTITDVYGNVWTSSFNITVTPIQAGLSVDRIGVLYDYNSGNNDSFFNKGETVHFDLGIQNTGSSTAIGVKISTSSFSDPYITVTNTCSTGYDIGGGSKRDTDGDFSSSSYYLARNSSGCLKAAAASNTPNNYAVTVPVKITDAYGNIWNSSFELTVLP